MPFKLMPLAKTANELVGTLIAFFSIPVSVSLPSDDTMALLKVIAVSFSIFASTLAIIWWAWKLLDKIKNK